MEGVVIDLMIDSDHLLSVQNSVAKRKDAKMDRQRNDDALLPADMERINKVPPAVLVDTLANLGDLSSDDIILCKGFDVAADTQLTTFATGLPPTFTLNAMFRGSRPPGTSIQLQA